MRQNEDLGEELMMLPTDLALISDPSFKKWVEVYASDRDQFYQDFANVFAKLIELGVDRSEPVSRCTSFFFFWASSCSPLEPVARWKNNRSRPPSPSYYRSVVRSRPSDVGRSGAEEGAGSQVENLGSNRRKFSSRSLPLSRICPRPLFVSVPCFANSKVHVVETDLFHLAQKLDQNAAICEHRALAFSLPLHAASTLRGMFENILNLPGLQKRQKRGCHCRRVSPLPLKARLSCSHLSRGRAHEPEGSAVSTSAWPLCNLKARESPFQTVNHDRKKKKRGSSLADLHCLVRSIRKPVSPSYSTMIERDVVSAATTRSNPSKSPPLPP